MAARTTERHALANAGLNEMMEIIRRTTRGEPDIVPPGWYTSAELQAGSSSSQRSLQEKIVRLLKKGTIERRSFRITTVRGLFSIPHYKIRAK